MNKKQKIKKYKDKIDHYYIYYGLLTDIHNAKFGTKTLKHPHAKYSIISNAITNDIMDDIVNANITNKLRVTIKINIFK